MPKTRNIWTQEMDDVLGTVYPAGNMDDLLSLLPGVTKSGIYQRAVKLGIRRWNQGSAPIGSIAANIATGADVGWLAGIVDGEGSLALRYCTRGDGRFYLSPAIRVVNNDKGLSQKVKNLMGGLMSQAPSRPTLWLNQVTGAAQCAVILEELLPHLTVKKERAIIMIEYMNVRRSKPGKAPYGDEERALYNRFYHGSGRTSAYRNPRQLNEYANPEPSSDDESWACVEHRDEATQP